MTAGGMAGDKETAGKPATARAPSEPSLWDLSLDMIATADLGGNLTRVNSVWEQVLGYSPAELTARPYIDFVHPDDVQRTLREAAALTDPECRCVRYENRCRARDGSYRCLSWSCVATDGVTIYLVVRDVSAVRETDLERERLYELLREREHLPDGVVENAPIGMAVTTLYGKVLRANHAMREITGCSDAELRGMSSLDEITHPEDVEERGAELRWLGTLQPSTHRRVKRLVHARGHVVWVEASTSIVCDASGDRLHMVAQLQDISVRRELEERLQHFADIDALTGMRNRRIFEDDLRGQLARCQRYGEHAALLMLDLNNFKRINDTYGHDAGDDVLKAVAAALMARVREGDLAARIGGDEFCVILTHVTPVQAEAIAADFQRVVLACTVTRDGKELHTGVSIGVAIMDEDSADHRAVLAAADASMYSAKRSGSATELIPPSQGQVAG